MNKYISGQIANMLTMTKTFDQSCKMAAMKDDGTIDKSEQRILKKIKKANDLYIKELEAITREL